MTNDFATIDIEKLMETIAELGIDLTDEERKYFDSYCRELVYANPKLAAEKIISALEKIAKQKLTAQEKSKLAATEKCNKWADLLEKEKNHERPRVRNQAAKPFTICQIKILIKMAAQRLNIKLSTKQINEVVKDLLHQVKLENTPCAKANAVLLGVIKVVIAGSVRIVLMYNWGNLISAPDVTAEDSIAPIELAEPCDQQGIEFQTVLNILAFGALNPNLVAYLENNNPDNTIGQDEQNIAQQASNVPTLKPQQSPTSTNPLEE